jgi:ABC-2 type transport system permease protein
MSGTHERIKSSTMSLTSVFLVLGILFFINLLSYRIFYRVDLTERKEYTISETTRNLLRELDDIINVTAYFSRDLPAYHSSIRTQVQDILSEFEAYSNHNLQIQYVDPGGDDELKERLARMGIPEVPLGEIKRDRQVVTMGYMAIAMQYGDRGEVIPFVPNVANLEYDLTSAILKVKEPSDHIITWIGNLSSDRQDPQDISILHEELNKNYIVRPEQPGNVRSIPAQTSVVVVDGRADLPNRALYAIDQYLMNNGNVIFLTDGVKILQAPGLSAHPESQDIHDLLEHYGITVSDTLVADKRHAQAAFSSGHVRFRLPYPLWPMIVSEGFDPDTPSVSQLDRLVLPWSSPLELESSGSNFEIRPLATTSDVSWRMASPFDLNPQQNWNAITSDDIKRSVLVAEIRGNIASYFQDRPIPEPDIGPGESFSGPVQDDEKIERTGNARFIVIASTRFVNNQFLSMHPENIIFFQNIIDSMAIGDALIGIRSRVVTHRPLDFGTTDEKEIEAAKTRHRIMGIAFIPIFIVLFGLIRSTIAKRRKRQMIVSD